MHYDARGQLLLSGLKSDPALAAALILAGSFPDLVLWAMNAFGGKDGAKANGAGKSNSAAKSDGAKKGVRAKGRHNNSRETAAKHDQALLALMRANPDANVTEIIRVNGRPRNSTVLPLERLEKAGLVEHARRGKWTVIDPAPKPHGPEARGWVEPLSGAQVARHAADGRVRHELTMG
jgi:hypothetical protein